MPKVTTEVKFTDMSEEVLKAMKDQVALGLKLIGQEAEGYAKDECPVDTSRLVNSISYATKDSTSGHDTDSMPKAIPEENSVYIGTNVEYAEYVEYGEKAKHTVGRAHFLRDAATKHNARYKEIMEAALKS